MAWLKPHAQREYSQEHFLAPVITLERRTLAQRMGESKLSTGEALRLAVDLAQAMRTLHDAGRAHGALNPSSIELTGSGIELIASRAARGVPTPYSAPETLKGQPADARSDIFSFGAILFEMVAGRWPFEANTPEALAIALQNDPAPQTGNPAVDSILTHCLAKDPAARWQRVQKLQMELRLALVAARGAEGPARREQFESVIRCEIQSAIESQVETRLASQETAAARLHQSVAASSERMNRAERMIELAGKRTDEFAANTAVQLHALEQTVRAQAAALEAARAALAQTDDLVERVVEALDSLQSTVLERSDFFAGTIVAQNRMVRPISG